jgi:hypothetical protein
MGSIVALCLGFALGVGAIVAAEVVLIAVWFVFWWFFGDGTAD